MGGMQAVGTPAVQDSLPPRSYLLPTVRVVADSPLEALASVKRVEPSKREAAITLYEGLQKLPGISNTVGTKDESNLRLRGFRKNELKLMVNGRPLSAGYFGNVDAGNFSLDGIAELQIISGPAASMYGGNNLGGVVNLIRRDPTDDEWGSLSLTARRNNTNRLSLSSAHRFSKWSYRLAASREHSDGMALSQSFEPTGFENGGIRDNQFKTLWNLDADVYLHLSEWQQLGISGGWGWIPKKRLPSSVFEASYRQYLDWRRQNLTLMWEGVMGQNLSGAAMLYYDGGGDRYQEFNDSGFTNLGMDSVMRHHSVGLAPRFKLDLHPGSDLQFGLNSQLSYNERQDNGFYTEWSDHTMGQHNAWLQWQFQPSRLSINAGLGLSAWHHDEREGLKAFLDPSLGLSWKHDEDSSSRISIGINSSYPTMRQIFSSQKGNPLLDAQRAFKTELAHSASLMIGSVRSLGEINLYYNSARDLIDLQGERYQNIYRVDSWGLESSLLLVPVPDWEFSLAYAYLEYSANSDYRLTESPKNSLVAELSLPLVYGIRLKLNSGWNDIRHSQDASSDYHVLPAYWKHDLSLSRVWTTTTASLGLENLLDANFYTEYGYPAPGLDFFVKLSQAF
jgi:outer membrane cobalamin receptor